MLLIKNTCSQKLPKLLKEDLSGFYKMCTKFSKIGKYSVKLVGGMYEKQVFVDRYQINLLQRKALNRLL